MPDRARLDLGIAPRWTSSGFGDLGAAYEAQPDAVEDVRRCTRNALGVEVLAVRGLGLLGLSDSVLRPVLARGTALRVLLLDPASDAARRRASEIGESGAGFAAGIELALTRLADLAEARPDLTVECGLYASMPTWWIVALEPTIFVSSFGADHEGHRSTMYKLSRTDRPGSLWAGFRRFLGEQHAAARRVL